MLIWVGGHALLAFEAPTSHDTVFADVADTLTLYADILVIHSPSQQGICMLRYGFDGLWLKILGGIGCSSTWVWLCIQGLGL